MKRLELQLLFVLVGLLFIPFKTCCQEANVLATDQNIQFSTAGIEPNTLILTNIESETIFLTIPNLDCSPLKIYKNENRYFFTCKSGEKITVWELEMDMERAMQLDLSETDLSGYQLLKP